MPSATVAWMTLHMVRPSSLSESDVNTDARPDTAHHTSTPTTTLTVAIPFLSTSSSAWVGLASLEQSSIPGGAP